MDTEVKFFHGGRNETPCKRPLSGVSDTLGALRDSARFGPHPVFTTKNAKFYFSEIYEGLP